MGLPEKNKFLSAGKHFAFEGLASVSLLLVFSLVVVTGAMSFVRLNTVIRSVDNAIGQDKPL